jgi:hypothetical protein
VGGVIIACLSIGISVTAAAVAVYNVMLVRRWRQLCDERRADELRARTGDADGGPT